MATEDQATSPSGLERFLRLFADVRAGEGATALLLLSNLFLLLVGYYVLKTVREPLILATGGAELKSYAAAGQALALMGFIPLYSWFSSRVDREKLVLGVTLFFLVNVELFYLGAQLGVPYLGVIFYIWVGIFSLATIAQFWSYANDLYAKEAGDRLFPMIAIGATAGSPLGAELAKLLFKAKVAPYTMLHVTAAILLAQLVLYWLVNRRTVRKGGAAASQEALAGPGGFALVFQSRYLLLIAGLLIVLNIVNTTGEYILGSAVVAHADASGLVGGDKEAYIGAFYGDYFFWVNILAVTLQAFVVSRLVRLFGIAGVILASPLIALGAYGFVAAGAAFAAIRWAKTAENGADYSIMNTGKQMLWLPTTRAEKYKAKQAIDTFFVRLGDVVSAAIVFAGTHWLLLSVTGFAWANLALVAVWAGLAFLLLRENRRLAGGR